MVFEALRRTLRNSFRWKSRPKDDTDGKNLLKCKVALLDGTDISVNLQKQAYGKDLMIRVLRHLDLVEKDYFGLQYMDTNSVPHWIDPTKKVRKQVRVGPPFTIHFRVKFYAIEPHILKEELTRYHFFLQLKHDVREGKLHPSAKQAIDLGAFAVQSELGDFDNTIHIGNYISEFRLVKDQSAEIEQAVEKKHRLLAGMNPAECEVKYLNIAQNLDYYGMDRHEVMGEDRQTCIVGLTPKGIVVIKNGQKLGDHTWRSITNITFKQSRFILCAKTNENEQQEYRFELSSSRASKHLWKCAIEYHSFFRLVASSEEPDRSKPTGLLSFGSRFRYSGKTLHQTTKDDTAGRKSMMFKRTRSERFAQRSTIGYIRIGSNVWAKAVNGDYYKGVVTAMTDKVHVKFDNGDTIAHEKNVEENNIVYDMPPNPNELKIGTQVIAHWSGVSAYLAGTITKIEGTKYHVLYEDGDKGTNRVEQMRILKPPLYFGPGSGRSNLQKKYSMKTTILSGDAGKNSVTDGPSRVQVEVNSRNLQKSQSQHHERSESSRSSNVQKSASLNQQRSESPRTSSKHESSRSSSKHSERSHVSNGNTAEAGGTRGEKSHSSHHSSSRSSSKSSSKSNRAPPESVPLMDKGAHRNTPPLNARKNEGREGSARKNEGSGKSYQITDL